MKKKIIFGLVLAGAVAAVFLGIRASEKLAVMVEKTEVREGDLVIQYELPGEVTSEIRNQYFAGTITRCFYSLEDHLEKGDVILEYLDPFGKTRKLKSETGGYLIDLQQGTTAIREDDIFVTASLPYEKLGSINEEGEYGFECLGHRYLLKVRNIHALFHKTAGRVEATVDFQLNETSDLKIGLQGNITIEEDVLKNVLIVDKRAILQDEEGFYLLSSRFLDENGSIKRYRLDIKVLGYGSQEAAISGIGLQKQEVLIINDELKELLK